MTWQGPRRHGIWLHSSLLQFLQGGIGFFSVEGTCDRAPASGIGATEYRQHRGGVNGECARRCAYGATTTVAEWISHNGETSRRKALCPISRFRARVEQPK